MIFAYYLCLLGSVFVEGFRFVRVIRVFWGLGFCGFWSVGLDFRCLRVGFRAVGLKGFRALGLREAFWALGFWCGLWGALELGDSLVVEGLGLRV